ncbi:MAG TPA: hypothetical protein VF782_00930 [Allosphingosinicella sp.]|jgi:hypothetical protein
MFTRSSFASAAMACLAVCSTLAAPASSLAAQGRSASDVAGTWAGSFVQTEWTFEFKREGAAWSGRYMSAKDKKWQPMRSLAVSGRTVQFGIDSKPPVTFSLKVDSTNKILAGDVAVFGRKLPFSAARRS